MLRQSLFLYVVLQCVWLDHFAYAIDCYQCNGIKNIYDCHNVAQCNSGEICYTERTLTGASMTFTLGCRSGQTCQASNSIDTLVGRDVSQDCNKCCTTDACNKRLCKDGVQLPTHWLSWQTWSSCSVTCGIGFKLRSRTCDNPTFTANGEVCLGDASEETPCDAGTCAAFVGWSSWTSWSGCSVSCGVGLSRRTRTCTQANAGDDSCKGEKLENKVCFPRACADGNWSGWSGWSTCSSSCKGGIQSRSRTCTSPAPSNFGRDCVGNSKEVQACNTLGCPQTNGAWSSWSSWSSCRNSRRQRTRFCNNPTPSVNGQICLGSSVELDLCGPYPIRLVNGSSPLSGRLEVFSKLQWGTVCGIQADNKIAEVVCRMKGFETDKPYVKKTARCFGMGTAPIVLGDFKCRGNENDLMACNQVLRATPDKCTHNDDAGVVCAPPMRLADGPNSQSGRLEVKYNGKWGTVCDDNFDVYAARIVCRFLGFPDTNVTWSSGYNGTLPIVLDDVNCFYGGEQSLEECQHRKWGTSNCQHTEDVGITCR